MYRRMKSNTSFGIDGSKTAGDRAPLRRLQINRILERRKLGPAERFLLARESISVVKKADGPVIVRSIR
jgi:hypothetical protein